MHAKIILFGVVLGFITNTALAIKPEKNYSYTPEDFGLSYENKFLQVNDTCKILTWHILPETVEKEKKTSIIISSGDAGNMSNYLIIAANLSLIGFDIWLYDYRGFGESCDFPIDQNMLYYNEFLEDLTKVIDEVKVTNPDNKICLLSYSMGSIISTMYLAENKKNVDYYIGEGHVYSPLIVINRIKQSKNKNVEIPLSLTFPHDQWENYYQKIEIPVLLFCAENDLVCSMDDVKSLQESIKDITIVNYEGLHLTGLQTLQDDYFMNIDSFLSQ